MRTLSLDSTPAYVDPIWLGVLWPSRTQRAFLVKSILTSQTRCPVVFLHPTGACCPSFRTSKATPTSVISFAKASFQRVFPFFSSIAIAWLTLVGISIPYFWVVFLILALTLDRIISRFRSVYGTHHANAGSSAMLRALANSAVSHGCDSFKSFRGIQDSDWSFHLTSSFHPTVVLRSRFCPLGVTTCESFFGIATASSFW